MFRVVTLGLAIVAGAVLVGCGEEAQSPKPTAKVTHKSVSNTPYLVNDPVSAVKNILPTGWVVQDVKKDAYPTYRPEGKGRAIVVGKAGSSDNATIFIMPSDYQDGGSSASVKAAKMIASTQDAKIYMTGWSEGAGKVVNALVN